MIRNGFTSEPAVMGRKQVVIPAQLEPMIQELNREYRRQREEIAGSNPPQSPAERELGNFKSIFAVLGNWAEFITNAHWMNSVSVTSMGSQVSGGIRMRNDVHASSPVYEDLISEFNRLTGRNLAEDMKKGKGKQRAADDLKPFFSLTLPISRENREQVLRLFKELVLLTKDSEEGSSSDFSFKGSYLERLQEYEQDITELPPVAINIRTYYPSLNDLHVSLKVVE